MPSPTLSKTAPKTTPIPVTDQFLLHHGDDALDVVRRLHRHNLAAHALQTHPDRVERLVFAGVAGPRHSDAAALTMSKYAQLDSIHMSQLGEILGSLMSDTAADPLVLCRDHEMFVDEMALANGEPNHWQGNSCNAPPGR